MNSDFLFFSLSQILGMQTPATQGYFFPEPILYQANKYHDFATVVKYHSSKIIVNVYGKDKKLDIGSNELIGVRHDIVASGLTTNTDMPIGILRGAQRHEFVEFEHLTPDCIDMSSRCVAELATTMSDELNTLQNVFENKRKKYEYILKSYQPINFYVLVVSSNYVYSNMLIPQDAVNELCSRMRMGLEVESRVCGLLGQDIFRDAEVSSDEIKIEKILEAITYSDNDFVRNFDKTVVDIALEPLKKEELREVKATLNKTIVESRTPFHSDRKTLEDYLAKFTRDNTTMKQKRCCNFPFVFSTESKYESPERIMTNKGTCPLEIFDLWSSGMHHYRTVVKPSTVEESIDSVRAEALVVNEGIKEEEKHKKRELSVFPHNPSLEHKIGLAKKGVHAKSLENHPEVRANYMNSKVGFSPTACTEDIEVFLTSDTLEGFSPLTSSNKKLVDILVETKEMMKPRDKDNLPMKETSGTLPKSCDVFKDVVLGSSIINFAGQISATVAELVYQFRKKSQKDRFLIKKVPNYNVWMILKPTGSHLFVSYCFDKEYSKQFDTGKLGPELYDCDGYIISDFCSYDESFLEHLIKAGPYMAAMFSHLLGHYQVDIERVNQQYLSEKKEVWRTMKLLLLLYLNNKFDSEELITSQRYLFMRVMEDINPDIYSFTSRLPSVIRSRLCVFFLKETIKIMDYYADHPIVKLVDSDSSGKVSFQYINIKSPFANRHITLEQKVNEFYFGYVISKEKGKNSGNTFKILKKILSEEYWFQDNVKGDVFYSGLDPKKHCTQKSMLKYMIACFGDLCRQRYGKDYKQTFKREIIRTYAYCSFSSISTLKASSKTHNRYLDIPIKLDNIKKNIEKAISESNPYESKQRPKVIEAITILVKNYIEEKKLVPNHLFELVPYCLEKIESKGSFDSDVFPKSQHGGDREIHVLEIMARIVQFFLETLSKVICSKFPSETITHPGKKSSFVEEHYKTAAVSHDDFLTVCKSADISKWCQRHHTSKFCSMLLSLTDPIFHGFIFRTLKLWVSKHISFPLSLVSTFLANRDTPSDNKEFTRLRSEFYSGTGVFEHRNSNNMKIESGMFQGILHYTSSLCHTMGHEVCREIAIIYAKKHYGMDLTYTIVQGSDDSAAMMSTKRKGVSTLLVCKSLLTWKELIFEYLSMFYSKEKTSCGTIDLVEYNSEWYNRRCIMKPTCRWVSASMETTIVERFVDRYRIFYNTLSQCLEGGASTFECALIQLCQAWLHYKLLGLENHILFDEYSKLLISNPIPAYGFFPLDSDIMAGIPGFEYQMFILAKNTKFGNYLEGVTGELSDHVLDYEGKQAKNLSSAMKSLQIGFGKLTIWKSLLKRIDIGTIQDAIDATEKDPMLVFGRHTTWEEDKTTLLLKLFSPGVKSSLSSYQPIIRMMVASAYMLNTACMTRIEDLSKIQDELNKSKVPTLDDLGMSISFIKSIKFQSRVLEEHKKGSINLSNDEIESLTVKTIKERVYVHNDMLANYQSAVKEGAEQIAEKGRKLRDAAREKKEKDPIRKMSLYKALSIIALGTKQEQGKEPAVYVSLEECFPLHEQYRQLESQIYGIEETAFMVPTEMRRTNKVKIEVFSSNVNDDFPLIDMCKTKWFGHRLLPLSKSQFDVFWHLYRMKYLFLRDTLLDTKLHMARTTIEVKMFLETVSLKSRCITLTDTSAKGGTIGSAATRIYWHDSKLRSPLESSLMSGTKLRSFLFGLTNFFYTREKTNDICRSCLLQSAELENEMNALPRSLRRMKIMRDYLKGKDKTLIVQDIIREKLGTIGFFSKVQAETKTHPKKYIGEGEWRGFVCGIDVVLSLQDDCCVKITLSKITDIVALGSSLKSLMRELHCDNYPELTYHNKIMLNSHGRIVNTTKTSSISGVPIEIDNRLHLHVVDEILAKPWKFEVSNMTLRLVILETRGSKFTILNDTLRVADWDPSVNEEYKKDKLLDAWLGGKSISSLLLYEKILRFIPKEEKMFKNWVKTKKENQDFIIGEYDLYRMLTTINSMAVSNKPMSEDIQEQIMGLMKATFDPFDVTSEEIDKLLTAMEDENADFEDATPDWADAVLEEENKLLSPDESELFDFGLDDITLQQLDRLCMEVTSANGQIQELTELEMLINRGMPASNKFWELLLHESFEQMKMPLDKLVELVKGKEQMKLQGALGIIMSLIIGRSIMIEAVEGSDQDRMEMAFDLQSNTINSIGGTSLNEMQKQETLSSLQVTLDQLNEIIPNATGDFLNHLYKLQFQTIRRLHLLKEESTQADLIEIDYDVFIMGLLDLLISENLADNYYLRAAEIEYLIPIFKMELNSYLQVMLSEKELSIEELSTARVSVRKNEISHWLLDIISKKYSISISVMQNKLAVYKSQEARFQNIEIEFDIMSNTFSINK